MQSLNKLLIKSSTVRMITRSQHSSRANTNKVVHCEAIQEFRMIIDNNIAKVEYCKGDTYIDLVHSYVPRKLRGSGLGHDLIKGTFDLINQANLKMKITCPFILKVYKENECKYKHLFVDCV